MGEFGRAASSAASPVRRDKPLLHRRNDKRTFDDPAESWSLSRRYGPASGLRDRDSQSPRKPFGQLAISTILTLATTSGIPGGAEPRHPPKEVVLETGLSCKAEHHDVEVGARLFTRELVQLLSNQLHLPIPGGQSVKLVGFFGRPG